MKLKKISFIIFGSLVLLGTFFLLRQNNILSQEDKITYNHYFAILPHFMIANEKVDNFYNYLYEKYNLGYTKNLNIVLISPNHFNLGNRDYISPTLGRLCYDNECINVSSLKDNKIIFNGTGDEDIFQSDYLFKHYTDSIKTKEHGIGEHFVFLNKYFDKKKIYTLVINPNKLYKSDDIIKLLENKFKNKNTLFLASVDFSHYVEEKYAYIHDRKTFYTLNNSYNEKDYKQIEVDCPNCLYILNKLAFANKQFPRLYYRDSSNLINPKTNGYENTSRLFISYDKKKTADNGLTLSFFGNINYNNEILKEINKKNRFDNLFSDYFSLGNTESELNKFKHRRLFGLDFVGAKLKPLLSENISNDLESKFLYNLEEIGFNIFNIMNSSNSGHLNYNSFGKSRNNYIYSGEIRGIKFAWHGYNILNDEFEKYCNKINSYKENEYINFVFLYGTDKQEFCYKFIDCGADILISDNLGKKQNISRYKSKPIIYNLGDFFSEQKSKGIEIIIDYNISGKIDIFTGEINAIYKGLLSFVN